MHPTADKTLITLPRLPLHQERLLEDRDPEEMNKKNSNGIIHTDLTTSFYNSSEPSCWPLFPDVAHVHTCVKDTDDDTTVTTTSSTTDSELFYKRDFRNYQQQENTTIEEDQLVFRRPQIAALDETRTSEKTKSMLGLKRANPISDDDEDSINFYYSEGASPSKRFRQHSQEEDEGDEEVIDGPHDRQDLCYSSYLEPDFIWQTIHLSTTDSFSSSFEGPRVVLTD
eukprot:12472647-Ditylum_brightwellii.AAC.1